MAVGSAGWVTHMSHLREFQSVMRKARFTLNIAKCEFAQSEVHLLGHIVGSEPNGLILCGLQPSLTYLNL